MNVLDKVQHYIRTIRIRYGSSGMKKKVWDDEFLSGKWEHLESTQTDPVYGYIAKYAKEGSVLDLGCGTGTTFIDMGVKNFSSYTGVDISSVAIGICKSKCYQVISENRVKFAVGDIITYEPDRKYDVILFRESICYFPRSRIASSLNRYIDYLSTDGHIIIRLYDRNHYAYITQIIENHFAVVDRYEPHDDMTIIMVLSGKGKQ